MGIDYETANRLRDRRLRRKFINALRITLSTAPCGDLDGRTLCDLVGGDGQPFTDDEHALMLLRELAAKGLIQETDTRKYPRRQAFSLDYLRYKITDKGLALWNESLPADADIDDDRLPE